MRSWTLRLVQTWQKLGSASGVQASPLGSSRSGPFRSTTLHSSEGWVQACLCSFYVCVTHVDPNQWSAYDPPCVSLYKSSATDVHHKQVFCSHQNPAFLKWDAGARACGAVICSKGKSIVLLDSFKLKGHDAGAECVRGLTWHMPF